MVKLRLQKVSDAERFFNILNNPNFIYFDVRPKTIEDEIAWLEQNAQRQKDNTQWNYTILYNEEIVGAIGVQINYHRQYIGEIGYFLDEKYWNMGIGTKAVELMEDICRNKLNLTRIEISMMIDHIASEIVAIKNNYVKEGIQHGLIKGKDGKMKDCYLYAKTF
jgi:ribosomal-protein-alanine N-acetyltransferase